MTDADHGAFERHDLPNGDTVFYRESDHSYWGEVQEKGGKWSGVAATRLPSPSTISKYADPSPDLLMGWAAKKTCDGVVLLGDASYGTGAELHDLLRRKKLTWRDLRDKAGDEGTWAHWAFENAMRGEAVGWEKVPEAVHGYLAAIDRFMADHPEIDTAQQEQVVYSKDLGYAGRFDWRGFLDGELAMLDLKTSKYIGLGYHYQLALYERAARDCGVGFTDSQKILQVKADGSYALIDSQATQQDALDCLRMYQSAKQTEKAAKQAMKAAA